MRVRVTVGHPRFGRPLASCGPQRRAGKCLRRGPGCGGQVPRSLRRSPVAAPVSTDGTAWRIASVGSGTRTSFPPRGRWWPKPRNVAHRSNAPHRVSLEKTRLTSAELPFLCHVHATSLVPRRGGPEGVLGEIPGERTGEVAGPFGRVPQAVVHCIAQHQIRGPWTGSHDRAAVCRERARGVRGGER